MSFLPPQKAWGRPMGRRAPAALALVTILTALVVIYIFVERSVPGESYPQINYHEFQMLTAYDTLAVIAAGRLIDRDIVSPDYRVRERAIIGIGRLLQSPFAKSYPGFFRELVPCLDSLSIYDPSYAVQIRAKLTIEEYERLRRVADGDL